MNEIKQLLSIIEKLRGEDGCSWDKDQTIETLTGALIEETYELVESIEEKKLEDLKEELGDLIFLSFFIAYIGAQEGRFSLPEIIKSINEKLIRRHPHVFGENKESDVTNILKNWEKIKSNEEKNRNRKSIVDGIPKKLPEIYRFFKILDKLRRNNVTIENVDKNFIKEEFDKAISKNSEKEMVEFLKYFLIYCYLNKIDLPALIRKSEKMLSIF